MCREGKELPDSTPEEKRRTVKRLLDAGIHNIDELIERLKEGADREHEQGCGSH
jgi:hypothetical protein